MPIFTVNMKKSGEFERLVNADGLVAANKYFICEPFAILKYGTR